VWFKWQSACFVSTKPCIQTPVYPPKNQVKRLGVELSGRVAYLICTRFQVPYAALQKKNSEYRVTSQWEGHREVSRHFNMVSWVFILLLLFKLLTFVWYAF
jgi:hypothetical protein